MNTSNYKKATFGIEARIALVRGMRAVSKLVGVTLGPKGRNVMLEHRAHLAPHVSKDGVEVARNLTLRSQEEEVGARLLRNAAITVSESFGDGTSTATVFAADLVLRSLKLVAAGANPVGLRRGIGLAAFATLNVLGEMVRPADLHMLTAVARTAANGDEDLAKLLARAYQEVGADGTIEIEIGNTTEDVLEVKTGSFFETIPLIRGLLPPGGHLRFARPLLLFCDSVIEEVQEILPTLEVARCLNRPVVIMADSVGPEVETLLLRNHHEGILKVAVVRAPMFGDTRRDALLDLVARFGGTPFGKEGFLEAALRPLKSLKEGDLGQSNEAVIGLDSVTLRGGASDSTRLNDRIALVRAEIERGNTEIGNSPSGKADYIEKRCERLNLLNSGSAKLHVGGQTDLEIKHRLPLVENANRALKAAANSGVLPGGGVALLRAGKKIEAGLQDLEGDEGVGATSFLQSLEVPFRLIVENAGLRSDDVLAKVLAMNDEFFGFNAATGCYGDLVEEGVLDAFLMLSEVLNVGVSVTGSTLNVGALVTSSSSPFDPLRFSGTEQVYNKLRQEGGFDE